MEQQSPMLSEARQHIFPSKLAAVAGGLKGTVAKRVKVSCTLLLKEYQTPKVVFLHQ